MKLNFTQASITKFVPPTAGRITLYDTHVAGLTCRVSHTGTKTFAVYRFFDGKPERITIGKFPAVSVDLARKEAQKINGSIASGRNPAEVKRTLKGEMTFEELFYEYLKRHAQINKKTWREDEPKYKQYLQKPLGRKRLSAIKKSDFIAIHGNITKEAARNYKTVPEDKRKAKSGARANRIIEFASSIFNWGIRVELCATNPARGIQKNKQKSRYRFLQSEELPRFFAAVAAEENGTIRDFIMLSILTGARRSNVMAMEWEHISFIDKEWRIPRTKNDDPLTIPLGEEALEILKNRKIEQREEAHKSSAAAPKYVLPGHNTEGHLKEPKKGWKRILEAAEIKDLRIHDLRRTLASWQAKTGASLVIIGKTLGHKSPQATAIYARLDLDPVRQSMQTATRAIFNASKEQKATPDSSIVFVTTTSTLH